MTQEEFIKKATNVHGSKYDLSRVVYSGIYSKVLIVCSKHGEFKIAAHNFLNGQGCAKCKCDALKSHIHGVGINDMLSSSHTKAYETWHQMLQRCYSKKFQKTRPSYMGCVVCDEWLVFSKFKEWFDKNYRDGYCLDKDILSGKHNKIYSEATCCFIPYRINSLIVRSDRKRGDLPIGVSRIKGTERYEAHLSRCGATRHRIGCFNTVNDAFLAYKAAKEEYIRNIAEEYYLDGKIEKRVYDALENYKVEITD